MRAVKPYAAHQLVEGRNSRDGATPISVAGSWQNLGKSREVVDISSKREGLHRFCL
jgi:hypothetical protein